MAKILHQLGCLITGEAMFSLWAVAAIALPGGLLDLLSRKGCQPANGIPHLNAPPSAPRGNSKGVYTMSGILGNAIVLTVLAATAALAARSLWKSHKRGGSCSCGCDCANCGSFPCFLE